MDGVFRTGKESLFGFYERTEVANGVDDRKVSIQHNQAGTSTD